MPWTNNRVGIAIVAAVASVSLAACGEDGYEAPEREVAFDDVFDDDTRAGFLFDELRYRDAFRDVAEVQDEDASDPDWLLDDEGASTYAAWMITLCAWSTAASAGEAPRVGDPATIEGFDAISDRLLEVTEGEPCSLLDENAFARLYTAMRAQPETLAEWMLAAEAAALRSSIADELSPEIAEEVAG